MKARNPFRVRFERRGDQLLAEPRAFEYVNTKWHKPYLFRLDATGNVEFQPRFRDGWNGPIYYDVSNLKVGDWIQAAGGSFKNKYPLHGQVLEVNLQDNFLLIREVTASAFAAERRRREKEAQTNTAQPVLA